MALWIDKQRPTSLSKLTIHPNITEKLYSLARSEDLPHLLFYGPSGAGFIFYFVHYFYILFRTLDLGKKTRVMALLKEIYGNSVEKIKLEHRTFKTSTNKTIEITTIGSNFHIECNPSDTGNNDRFVVQEVIKEIASHTILQGSNTSSRGFKVVILTEVDRLSKQAQASLRRTMEK